MAGLPPTITDATVTLTWGTAGQYYGYCTVADVGFEFPNKGSFATLTNSVIGQIITYTAQELQQSIGLIYAMPYAGTDGGVLLTLRNMNAKLATAELIDRYFQGGEPDMSPAAADRRAFVEALVMDLVNGTVHWDTPFGDAVALGEKPAYLRATAAQIWPSPNDIDPLVANPIFQITGQSQYRVPGF